MGFALLDPFFICLLKYALSCQFQSRIAGNTERPTLLAYN